MNRPHDLDPGAVARLRGRSLATTDDWSTADLSTVVDLGGVLADLDRVGAVPRLCPDELAYALFFDQSTRTRSAWAGAAARLGMHPVIVDGSSTQVAHGETAAETGAMLGMNAHALGVRHDLILGEGNRFLRDVQRGIDDYLAATDDTRSVPVVNLQCDVDHPTQTLADLTWLQRCFPEGLAGRRIAVSWASSPSYAKPLSVPQGLITLLTRFGADVTLAHPAGYDLTDAAVDAATSHAAESGGGFRVVDDMDEAFAGADAVYPKSWGPLDLMTARVTANRAGDERALVELEAQAVARNREHADWICDERRMALTADGDARYLHCLPADIGAEVSDGVMRRFAVDVARQANHKVYVIMALLAGAKVDDLAARLAAADERRDK
jgi:knotted carbamoyltransferase YgeW